MIDSIRGIAQQYLRKVKPSGNENIMAICPFHRKMDGSEEHTGSFAMNVYSGLWYCHSCHSRGNLITFLRDMGVPRGEVDLLYGYIIKEAEQHAPPKYNPLKGTKATEEPLPEQFLAFFDATPTQLLEDGYTQEVLRKFDVGFDETNQRITYPLRDLGGQLVGISGRALDNREPRYKVYDKEYVAFGLQERATQKRALLWNAHNVIPQLLLGEDPSNMYVVVNEGFKAVMRVDQAGISNVVGLLGSYMSAEQQQALESMGCSVLLMLDNNDAGQRGQLDAGLRLSKTVHSLFVVTYDAPQPSDLQPKAIIDAILSAQLFGTWFSKHKAKY